MTETEKQKKAVDLAIKRMGKFIKSARLVANLGNKNNYYLTDEQQSKMIDVCNSEVANIAKSLASGCIGGSDFNFEEADEDKKAELRLQDSATDDELDEE